ncbi:MAG: hypothetical protein ACREJT_06785 [Myxococcota bacterium]
MAALAALALAAVAVVPGDSLAQGCAMCATYLTGADAERAQAWKLSIMFLMAMPFIVVGSAGGWILWMHWRSRPQRPSLGILRAEREGAS